MAQVVNVKFESHKEEVLEAMTGKVITWLDAIGQDAAGVAADKAPVDTGRLKNSIEHAVVESEKVVYIGTNVRNEKGDCYAIYQEFGTSRGIPGKHFIQFGATAHSSEYKAMLEQTLKE